VIAEHRDDRHLEVATCVGDDPNLVDLPVLGQVAGKQDQVGLLPDAAESLTHPVALG
jgi:hypothetical protein